jgi:outer membrane protein OmpA-like peptidoglycan-associated protein
MSFNLLDVVKGHFSSDIVSKAASFLGENESGVSKAMGGILPTVLSGLASKASTSEGAAEVASMAGDTHRSGLLGNIGSFFGGGDLLSKGGDLIKGLFGGKLGGIVDAVASFAGIKSGAITSLMSMAAPVALGALGKHSADNNLGASGIASLLSSGKSSWASLLPAGLGSMLGIGGASNMSSVRETANTATNYATDTVDRASGGGMKWLLPLLLLGALGFLGWYLLKGGGCGKKTEAVSTDVPKDTTTTPTTTTTTVTMPTKESMKVKLANGVEIDAFKGGIESQLVAFLDDKAAMIDTVKGNWYDFDNLNFKLGKSDLTDSSMVQINNIVAILKAYPAVKMKIGGYTDASGNADANLKLSQARADAVMAAIVKSGGAAGQLTKAEGYGSKFAKEPATASDEARRKDRRTAVRIVAK